MGFVKQDMPYGPAGLASFFNDAEIRFGDGLEMTMMEDAGVKRAMAI